MLSYNPDSGLGKAIGFVLPNQDIDNSTVESFIKTIDEIELLTDLDLFSFLNNSVENSIESTIADFVFYDNLECPHKDCDRIYTGNRKLPEDRTKLICE